MYDIIIVGGGPAGLTAATYACRAGKTALVIEKNAFGGQITWSPRVENFPSYVSVSGTELGEKLLEQAMEQGAEVELDEVVAVRDSGEYKTVVCESGAEFEGRALIIAAGARPRTLGLAREEELTGSGVCFCAVCDGAFYSGKPVAVNGGGNSALQDAVLLSEKCSKVYLIHRRDTFRGEAKLVDVLKKKGNVEFVLNSTPVRFIGDGPVTGLVVKNNETVFIGSTCCNGVAFRLGVSLSFVKREVSSFELVACLVKLMYLNMIGVNENLIAVNLTLYVVFVGISELDRFVWVAYGLSCRVLVQHCGKLDCDVVCGIKILFL